MPLQRQLHRVPSRVSLPSARRRSQARRMLALVFSLRLLPVWAADIFERAARVGFINIVLPGPMGYPGAAGEP